MPNHPELRDSPFQAHILCGAMLALQMELPSLGVGGASDHDAIITPRGTAWMSQKTITRDPDRLAFMTKEEVPTFLEELVRLGLVMKATMDAETFYRVNVDRVDELYYAGAKTKKRKKKQP